MGLDMYLKASKYVSGFEHSDKEEVSRFNKIVKAIGLNKKNIAKYSYLIIGFRYQNPCKRSVVKIGFSPIIAKSELAIMPPVGSIYTIIPFPYFSYGLNF